MLLYTVVVRTPQESALKIDSGRKISFRTGGLKPTSVLSVAFQKDALQLSYRLLAVFIVYELIYSLDPSEEQRKRKNNNKKATSN